MKHRPGDRTVARQLATAAALRRAVRANLSDPPARGRHRVASWFTAFVESVGVIDDCPQGCGSGLCDCEGLA